MAKKTVSQQPEPTTEQQVTLPGRAICKPREASSPPAEVAESTAEHEDQQQVTDEDENNAS